MSPLLNTFGVLSYSENCYFSKSVGNMPSSSLNTFFRNQLYSFVASDVCDPK